jgi:hypothetical protein
MKRSKRDLSAYPSPPEFGSIWLVEEIYEAVREHYPGHFEPEPDPEERVAITPEGRD